MIANIGEDLSLWLYFSVVFYQKQRQTFLSVSCSGSPVLYWFGHKKYVMYYIGVIIMIVFSLHFNRQQNFNIQLLDTRLKFICK